MESGWSLAGARKCCCVESASLASAGLTGFLVSSAESATDVKQLQCEVSPEARKRRRLASICGGTTTAAKIKMRGPVPCNESLTEFHYNAMSMCARRSQI